MAAKLTRPTQSIAIVQHSGRKQLCLPFSVLAEIVRISGYTFKCSPTAWSFTHLIFQNIINGKLKMASNFHVTQPLWGKHFSPSGTRQQQTGVYCTVSSTIGLITKYYWVIKSGTRGVEHAANMGERNNNIHGFGRNTCRKETTWKTFEWMGGYRNGS